MEILERDAAGRVMKFRIAKPWDMHTHLRQDHMLKLVTPMTARQFHRFVAMPNTQPPITTCELLGNYLVEIMVAITSQMRFGDEELPPIPLMTFYLTDNLDPAEVAQAVPDTAIGVKYYPHGLTTNSDLGVADPAALWTEGTKPYQVLRVLAEKGGTLLLHAADGVDRDGKELGPYDQEEHFINKTLGRIRDAHQDLRMVVEHLSTGYGVRYMQANGGPLLGCTITAHHLLLDQRDTHRGGLHVHEHCWPIIQPEEHKLALRDLVAQDRSFVFLGSDSAPHPISRKETECVAGGLFTAPAALELYAEAFDQMGCLDKLENFASINGPAFYDLTPDEEDVADIGTITLVRDPWQMPNYFHLCHQTVPRRNGHDMCIKPFRAGEEIRWKIVDE